MSFDEQTSTGEDQAVAASAETGDPVPTEPDAIRAEIERTRSDLSRDVNALGETVSPGSIAKRQTTKAATTARRALTQAKHRITPSGKDPRAGASSPSAGITSAASGFWDRAGKEAHTTVRSARGNPLAVGLFALAAGWLLVASPAQRDTATSERVDRHGTPFMRRVLWPQISANTPAARRRT